MTRSWYLERSRPLSSRGGRCRPLRWPLYVIAHYLAEEYKSQGSKGEVQSLHNSICQLERTLETSRALAQTYQGSDLKAINEGNLEPLWKL